MANFSKEKIQQIWEKAKTVKNFNKDKYRKDCCGAWMARNKYGEEDLYGWEIDHVYPSTSGGTDDLVNLRPMQWENNRSKSDDYPTYKAVKTAKGNKNIDHEVSIKVNETLRKKLKKKYNIK